MSAFSCFDQIVCIHLASAVERMAGIDAELKRTGIADSGRFRYHFTVRGEPERWLYDSARTCRMRMPGTDSQVNGTLSHLQVISSAYESGAESVLVLEDDVRFLVETAEIERIVGAWNRKAYPICLFDKFVWNDAGHSPDGDFVAFDKGVRGTSCYALTRTGMESAIETAANLLRNRRTLLCADEWFDYTRCPHCYAKKNICVQVDFDRSMNRTIFRTSVADVYRMNGVDLSAYQTEG